MRKNDILSSIKGGLIVSCQALEHEPLHSSEIMGRMALAALEGGAVGIRANSVEDINEIGRRVSLPIIGIIKRVYDHSDIYITPTIKEVDALIESRADIIAFDATLRQRPDECSIEDIIMRIHDAGKLAMADISIYKEGVYAADRGVDIVSTTLSGYTPYSRQAEEPDFILLGELTRDLPIPVIAEGRMKNPEHVIQAFEYGAFSVVVGGAITRPQVITSYFVDSIKSYQSQKQSRSQV